ncbi:2-oxoglutarate dehydrogenase E1 component, partial [Paraburkholderia sp. SIMBA_049]
GFDPAQIVDCLDQQSRFSALQRDLPYHFGGAVAKETPDGDVALVLAHNPSHLQSVHPVVSGMARAYQDEHPDIRCLPLVMHGDAAFA